MLLPIHTSIQPKRTPYANYALIAANIVIYILSYGAQCLSFSEDIRLLNWAHQFMLFPDYPYIWQFVTYAFLHGGFWHIFGNMYFLFMFGNNVNDKLGNVGYLCFYLAGAVFSGIGHSLLHSNPVLGASGAVAAVTGAYLVLFPNTLITVVYWFIIIGTVEFRALYFIAFKLIVWDNMVEPGFTRAAVAYDAHLAGYFFGMAAIIALLSMSLIERDFNDLWSMLKQWNRRRRFRDAVADGYDPYSGTKRKPVSAKVTTKLTHQEQEILDLRSQISRAMSNRAPAQAAAIYLKLIEMDSSQVLPRQLQLDIANQLMSDGKWEPSATAYERFLAQYSGYEYAEQVHLMLGLLYGRYLNRPAEAMEQLNLAQKQLSDPGQIKMCRQEMARLEKGK